MPRPEVFLSHASVDKASVRAIALQLQKRAIPIWLDEWNLVPGQPWVDALGQALSECSGCVVFLGPEGAGPWHHEEVRSALDLAARDSSYRLVPVLLPGAKPERLSQLPSFLASRTWVDFAKGLDDADAFHRLVCGIQGREPGPPGGVSYVPGLNPYRGLRVFDVDDAPLFFGRQVLTKELLAKLGPEPRFISIVGPSGSGKSSLARAGLLAALRSRGLPGSAEWPQIVIRPGAFPLEALAVGVATKLRSGADPTELIRRFEAREEALHREVRMALEGRLEHRAVILVDQAEEAFTLCTRNGDCEAFFANLVYAATVRTGQTLVMLAFRSDFYSRFAEHRQLAALVSENQLLVSPMSEAQLREAIVLPAERSGRPLRPALVEELLRDAADRPGSLPLLEHALAQLWERPEPALGIEEYRSIGGLAGALDKRAEEVFGKLTPSQQAACRRLFLRLVQPGEDALDSRRRIRGAELPADQREVSRAFSAERVHLLVASREGDQEVLELAHEELIRRWDRLRQWIHEDRLGQRIHRRLMAAAGEWSARTPDGRDESFLYRGVVLAEVEGWLANQPTEERSQLLNASEVAFLEHSRSAQDRARLDQERRVRDAEELATKDRALRAVQSVALSRELTAFVAANLNNDPQLNLGLLKQAHQLAETEEVFPVLAQWANALGRAELRGHFLPVLSATFSPDGLRIVTSSDDWTARLWDASSGKPLATLSGHSGPVWNAAFSPDGLRVVTASVDKTARFWDASSGKPLATLFGHSDSVLSAAFSPDGLRVITAGQDGTARLWDTSSGKPLATLSGHSGWVQGAAFSLDGLQVVTASVDRTARLWDTSSGEPLAILSGHSDSVLGAAFSPDGLRVVTASDDRTARLWDAASGKPLAILSGHSGWVLSAAFGPDGLFVVTSSQDGTARLWDASSGRPRATLSGHSGSVQSAAFGPDGLRVVTASEDRTARLWDASSGKPRATLFGHSGWVLSAAFSPDGLRVVTASEDRTARFWDASSGKPLATLSGHSDSVLGAAFSPDGLRVVTASHDTTAGLWDASSGKPLAILSGHSDSVLSASFTFDGLRVVTSSHDMTARLWDASSGKPLAILSGHSSSVLSAVFSPDGLRVVTSSQDGTARLWDTFSGKPLATLSGHSGWVQSVAFSLDGLRVVTASVDRTARVWDASSGKPLAILSGHSDSVLSAAFSPDSLRVVTSSRDTTARVWDTTSGKPVAILSGHSDSVLSAKFSPDGLRVVTASQDGTAFVWQDLLWAPRSKQLQVLASGRELTPEERQTYLHQ